MSKTITINNKKYYQLARAKKGGGKNPIGAGEVAIRKSSIAFSREDWDTKYPYAQVFTDRTIEELEAGKAPTQIIVIPLKERVKDSYKLYIRDQARALAVDIRHPPALKKAIKQNPDLIGRHKCDWDKDTKARIITL